MHQPFGRSVKLVGVLVYLPVTIPKLCMDDRVLEHVKRDGKLVLSVKILIQ
jgi:hypothetical protein